MPNSRKKNCLLFFSKPFSHNITNPTEIINGQKAILDELEPIEYTLTSIKTNVELINDEFIQHPIVIVFPKP